MPPSFFLYFYIFMHFEYNPGHPVGEFSPNVAKAKEYLC